MHEKTRKQESEKSARKQLQTPTPALPPRPSSPAYARGGPVLQQIGKREFHQRGKETHFSLCLLPASSDPPTAVGRLLRASRSKVPGSVGPWLQRTNLWRR